MNTRSRDLFTRAARTAPRDPIRRFLPHHIALSLLIAALSLFIPDSGSHPVQAASFDCSKAELPLDKLICQTPELSAKDDQMAAKYKAALAILSPEGQGILREGQRKWLKFVRTHCAARIGQPGDSFGGDGPACLGQEYGERLTQLTSSAQQVGPYVFSQVDDFQLTASAKDDANGTRSGFVYRIVSYPFIDSPKNVETQRWNQDAAAWVQHIKDTALQADASQVGDTSVALMFDPKTTDFDLYFDIKSAQAGFVSMCQYASWYDHGRPHGFTTGDCGNKLLAKNKELAVQRLFKAGSDWPPVANRFIKQAAKEADISPDRDIPAADKTSLPGTWTVTADTLTIEVDLQADDGYPGRSGFVVTIPWRELKPYLRADLPIKLNTE